jgi:serine/threonine-protein kinase
MPSKLTLNAFVKCLRRSGLVDEDRVTSLLRQLSSEGVDVDQPRAIATALVHNGTLTQWQAENLLQGKHRGFILGKYRLLALLGRGGMCAVYLAEHSLMRRRCAIKVLPTQKLNDPAHLARFHQEARAVASLDHTNIVRAYDVDQAVNGEAEVHFFVMEFVDGENLHDRVARKGPMTPVEAANYIRQAADGLAYAHGSGIVHRDIKPANLLVSRDDVVKILDLGLAKFFDDAAPPPIVKEERVLGTVDFLSPEQAVDGHAVDSRTDIYSLGCTFYFLLAAHSPFPEGTLPQRLLSHKTKEPLSIVEIRDDVPAGLAAVLIRMMAKKPADRYQTADDVSEVLRQWLVKHADPQWIRKNPAVLSDRGFLKKATVQRSKGTNSPSAGGAAESAAAGTGSTAAVSSGRSSKPNMSASAVSRAARPSETSWLDLKGSTPLAGSPPPPTSHLSGATTVEIDVVKVPPTDRHGSSAIDSLNRWGHRRSSASRVRRTPSPEIIALGLTTALAVLGGLAWFSSRETDRAVRPIEQKAAKKTIVSAPPAQLPPRRKIEGDIRVGPRGHFKTIGQAIDFVRESYAYEGPSPRSTGESRTIKVAGWHTYPESIDIENADFHFPKGLRIICDDPVPAILAPRDQRSVVRLNGVERFTLEGFEIDATGKRSGIELSGYLVGTRLRNLRIGGQCDTSILVRGAVAFERPESRCMLDHLVVRSGGLGSTGVRFESGIDPSSNLTITGCRFFGPFESAVTFNGPVVGINIRESIISRASAGVLVQGEGLAVKDLAIVNNTFHELNLGIVFRGMLPASSSGLIVQRNVFTEVAGAEMFVGRGVQRAGFLPKFAKGAATGNWTSRKVGTPRPEGEIDLFTSGGRTGADFQFQSTDPEDNRFLWPAANAPHKALGAVILK